MSEKRRRASRASKTSTSRFSDDKDEDAAEDDQPMETDAFYKKWAGPVLLGPFLPAIFAAFIIVAGQLTLSTASGTCGYDLASVVSANIGLSYVFLLVFTWVYMGDTVRLTISMINVDRVLLRPFRSLKWIMMAYGAIGFAAFVVGIYGAFILSLSSFCSKTSPQLYTFALFVVVLFWLGGAVVAGYLIKLTYGTRISKLIKENAREETMDEVEGRLVRSKFMEYAAGGDSIARGDLGKVLQALGMFVPAEEQDHLADTLDPSGSGSIAFRPFKDWFAAVNGHSSAAAADEASDSDDSGKLFK